MMLHIMCRTTDHAMPDPVGKGLHASELGSKGPNNFTGNDGAREANVRMVLASAYDATSQGSGLKGSVRASQGPNVVGPVMHVDTDSDIDQHR